MINILSYIGMNMQAEVCLWTLLGLMRTIFDATLFKVNANLKQVWQMSMPEELSMPVQRVLRTVISGIMLVQCFTVYIYLASYIVLLYPVFLEERPTLVLPWLLLAAIRKLLCELTSLALGLGTCVLLGTAKPACIKFLLAKIITIMPAFYMWMLVYSYYHALKVATAFKTFPVVLPPNGRDYGLELAVRRRCTKSLFGEEQLRKKLVAGLYSERPEISDNIPLRNASHSDSSCEETPLDRDVLRLSAVSHKYAADIGTYEDWFGSEIIIPRGDRIIEQFIVMLLRIGVYLTKDGAESLKSQIFNADLTATWATRENIEAMSTDITDTPPLVGNSKGRTASYLRDYPQIFMKKLATENTQADCKAATAVQSIKSRILANTSNEMTRLDNKQNSNDITLSLCNEKSSQMSLDNNNTLLPTLEETKKDSTFSDKHSNKLLSTEQEIDKRALGKKLSISSLDNLSSAHILLLPQKETNYGSKLVSSTPSKLELSIEGKEPVDSKDKDSDLLKNIGELIFKETSSAGSTKAEYPAKEQKDEVCFNENKELRFKEYSSAGTTKTEYPVKEQKDEICCDKNKELRFKETSSAGTTKTEYSVKEQKDAVCNNENKETVAPTPTNTSHEPTTHKKDQNH